jgi:hypothetical protein
MNILNLEQLIIKWREEYFFKGIILDVKVDHVTTQETKKIIDIVKMNRTIKQMQNKINRMIRGDNYMPNPRMPILEKRRTPPP